MCILMYIYIHSVLMNVSQIRMCIKGVQNTMREDKRNHLWRLLVGGGRGWFEGTYPYFSHWSLKNNTI